VVDEQHRRELVRTPVFRHAACATGLDERGHCSRCGVFPGPQDIVSERVPDRPAVHDDPVTIALRMPHRLLEPLEV
jgi:hypothetical protein